MSGERGGRPGRPPTTTERLLFREAETVAFNAYAPYSGFRVGAAVTGRLGRAHLGVNVENSSFPAGLCAERAALGAAVAAGERAITAVAVATADGRDAVPCGACLQALAEFGDPDLVCRLDGEVRAVPLHELLTAPFASLVPSEPPVSEPESGRSGSHPSGKPGTGGAS